MVLATLLLGSVPAPAQERVIRFGLTADYPPFALRLADGTLTGADVVVARQIAKRMRARAQFVATDWRSLEKDFAAKRFDVAIGGLTVTPERAAIGTYSIVLMHDGKRPLARCGERRRYRTLAEIDRPGTKVLINRTTPMIAMSKEWFRSATVTYQIPETQQLLDELLGRRQDVWITDGVVVDHMARRYRGILCTTTTTPFTQLTKAWLIQSDPALIAPINLGLKRALSSGAWLKALKAVK